MDANCPQHIPQKFDAEDVADMAAELRALDLVPVAEFQLTTDTIRKFRTGYVAAFGAPLARATERIELVVLVLSSPSERPCAALACRNSRMVGRMVRVMKARIRFHSDEYSPW